MSTNLPRTNKKDNSRHRFGGPGPRQDHNDYKRKEAVVRQEAYSKLSLQEKLQRQVINSKVYNKLLKQIAQAASPAPINSKINTPDATEKAAYKAAKKATYIAAKQKAKIGT